MSHDLERVFAVTDWYDGPRRGISNFRGQPHLFEFIFRDKDKDAFLLWPLDEETFVLACEDWEIWRRWEKAFQARRTAIDTHPALPADRDRHEELHPLLNDRYPDRDSTAILAKAEFKPSGEENGHASLFVCWSVVDVS